MFKFDLVLGPDSTTEQLFTQHVQPLMDNALQGINSTVFAYGQTGSGKTHTMFGTKPGDVNSTIGMAVVFLFQELGKRAVVGGCCLNDWSRDRMGNSKGLNLTSW